MLGSAGVGWEGGEVSLRVGIVFRLLALDSSVPSHERLDIKGIHFVVLSRDWICNADTSHKCVTDDNLLKPHQYLPQFLK